MDLIEFIAFLYREKNQILVKRVYLMLLLNGKKSKETKKTAISVL